MTRRTRKCIRNVFAVLECVQTDAAFVLAQTFALIFHWEKSSCFSCIEYRQIARYISQNDKYFVDGISI